MLLANHQRVRVPKAQANCDSLLYMPGLHLSNLIWKKPWEFAWNAAFAGQMKCVLLAFLASCRERLEMS